MEPNKLEKDFKNKLEQRTIQPTDMAWDRLDAMLSVTEKNKQPNKKYWMYIAASFLGFLLIGSLLLKMNRETTGETNTIHNTIVNSGQSTGTPENNTQGAEGIKDAGTVNMPFRNESVAVQQNYTPLKRKAILQRNQKETDIKEEKQSNTIYIKEEVVAEQEIHTTPAEETEKLLANSLDTPTGKKKSSVKVDANSLLSSVEGELDHSFRSGVLQKVVENYNTVKTSVANRNYQ